MAGFGRDVPASPNPDRARSPCNRGRVMGGLVPASQAVSRCERCQGFLAFYQAPVVAMFGFTGAEFGGMTMAGQAGRAGEGTHAQPSRRSAAILAYRLTRERRPLIRLTTLNSVDLWSRLD